MKTSLLDFNSLFYDYQLGHTQCETFRKLTTPNWKNGLEGVFFVVVSQ